jgi:phage terminase large subunit-like protein
VINTAASRRENYLTKKRDVLEGYGPLLRLAVRHFRDDEGLAAWVEALPAAVGERLKADWWWQAHRGQRAPEGDWTVWLLMAGRGFGKTRAGAEWVSEMARGSHTPHPPAASRRAPPSPRRGEGLRIALVGGTREDVVKVMIEGPSGLIRVARPDEEARWLPSRNLLEFSSGATAFVYSAEAPEGLRGPEHHFAWADELAKWPAHGADRCWDNLTMGLRLGDMPRCAVTTTPKPVPLLKRVMALPGTQITRGRTEENAHLPGAFVEWMRTTYGGTRLGRQELDGELIEDAEGTLFPRAVLEAARTDPRPYALPQAGEGEIMRVVVGVDPPASTEGTCGIVVCGGGADGMLHVLADASVPGATPERWARVVADAAEGWGADRVIAEKNMGGDMVGDVLRNADVHLPVRLVSASRGKSARAEPVAALFESGRAKLAGRFPQLEDELAGLLIGGGYVGPGRSPDRADACVWAMTALMRRSAPPGARFL